MIRRCCSLAVVAAVVSLSGLARGQDAPASVYVDDLDITKAEQGYGSRGKNVSAENNPVTLRGKTFAHAFGTHADGKLVIDTKSAAKRFSATVGVDDDTSGAGSVRFYVIGDGKLLAESGILTGGDAAKTLTCDLTGVKQLVLRCDTAGDGDGNDHADWADAKITLDPAATEKPVAVDVAKAVPELALFVDELDLTKAEQGYGDPGVNVSAEKHPVTLDGKTFLHAFGTHSNGRLVVNVKGAAKTFTATVGVDDDAGVEGSVRFYVVGDGKVLAQTDVIHRQDKPKELSVDITGVKQLVLKVDDGDDGDANDHADWGGAKITLAPAKAEDRPEAVDAALETKAP